MFEPRSVAALAALALGAAPLSAQFLYAQADAPNGNQLRLALKLTNAQANTVFTVATTLNPFLSVQTPATIKTDGRGYAAFSAQVTGLLANSTPLGFRLSVSHTSLPGGALVRSYLLRSRNGNIASAWPELMMSQGVFCNPVDSASTHLQIDRASDLDGDGVYGDLNREATANGRDPLDFPNEFATDCNATGTKANNGGSPPGVFYPGGSGRTVAFATDNRQVLGPCSFTTLMNFLEDMAYAPAFHGQPALFATSSSNDNVLICRDKDNDGSIGASEIAVFFNPLTLVNNENYSPDGIALDPTNAKRLWWISDKSSATGPVTNQGLFRLDDANADDVIGATEWKACWTGTTGGVQVEAQTIDASEFECLHVDSKGAVLVNQTTLGTIFRWVDANQNGVAETGEVANWLTYNPASLLTKSVDFQGTNFPILTGPFYAMNLIESAPRTGAGDVYFVALTNSTGAGAGFVFRCEDRNNDGDVNDLAEVTVFNDPAQIVDPFPTNFISGLAVVQIDENGNSVLEPGEIFVYGAYPNGPKPSGGYVLFNDLNVWRQRDLNADGDAFDAGESERVMIHATGAFTRGLELLPPGNDGGLRPNFYQRSALVTARTGGCTSTLGDAIELDYAREKVEEGTQGTPFGGNTRFELRTTGNGAGPAGVAGLVLGANLATTPFPLEGCEFWLTPPLFVDVIPPVVPDAAGNAKFPLPIPVYVRGALAVQSYALIQSKLVLGEAALLRIE